jgi:hypothetical protein
MDVFYDFFIEFEEVSLKMVRFDCFDASNNNLNVKIWIDFGAMEWYENPALRIINPSITMCEKLVNVIFCCNVVVVSHIEMGRIGKKLVRHEFSKIVSYRSGYRWFWRARKDIPH